MTNRTIPVPPSVKASEGRMFTFGRTSVYVGPREPSPNGRNLKRPPVLAYSRLGIDTVPHIVAEFPNAASAEQFMVAMMTGVEEMSEAAAGLAAALRQSPDGDDDSVGTTSDTPPASGGVSGDGAVVIFNSYEKAEATAQNTVAAVRAARRRGLA